MEHMTGKIHNVTQGTDDWQALRRGKLTASNMSKILTPTGKLSAQSTAYARKLARECVLDDPHIFMGNKYTDWGHSFENEAREAVAAAEGLDVRQVGFVTHHAWPVFGASPDGLIYEDGAPVAGLEIKCPAIDTLVAWACDGGLPDEHKAQVHASMAVTGLRRWEFAAYFPVELQHAGEPFKVPTLRVSVEWDEYTDKILNAAEGFVIQYAEIRQMVLGYLLKNKPTKTNHGKTNNQ